MNALPIVESLEGGVNRRTRRRVRTGGPAAERKYVVITSVERPEEYTGNVIAGPYDDTISTTGVQIRVPGATSNEFEVGYEAYADASTQEIDGKQTTVYILDGYLLG